MKPSAPWAGPRAAMAKKEAEARNQDWSRGSRGGWGWGSWTGQQ